MKKLQKIILILSIISFYTSCKKEVTELEFEKNVMTEIFPSLIRSTCFDTRMFVKPPPRFGKPIYDKNGNYVGIDSTKATKLEKEKLLQWEREISDLKKDTSKTVIAFNPVLRKSAENLKEYFKKNFPKGTIYKPNSKDTFEYHFDFKKIKLKQKFELKNISEFPKDRMKFWNTKYSFVFLGVVNFSRIEFDKDRKFGVLEGGFTCGRLCGNGFIIYIKKINGKWIIDKTEGTWVS
jgi:hypothetical protein